MRASHSASSALEKIFSSKKQRRSARLERSTPLDGAPRQPQESVRGLLAMSDDARSGAGVTLPDGRTPETARGGTPVPDNVLRAIYGDSLGEKVSDAPGAGPGPSAKTKAEQYDESLKHWWKEYADRKNDEEEEHVSDSLLYDYTHLPRSTPAPTMTDDRVKKTESGEKK
jgi:hypothetical protein